MKGVVTVMFKKVIVRTHRGTTEEFSVNTDCVVMIEPCSTKKIHTFDESVYMTLVWLNLDKKTTCGWNEPISGQNFCMPVEYNLVEKYFNNEVTFDEIKNYKIPKVEAPESLEEWVKMARYTSTGDGIKLLIRQGITTKSQLLNMTWNQVKILKGIGEQKIKHLHEILDCFGLSLKEEE